MAVTGGTILTDKDEEKDFLSKIAANSSSTYVKRLGTHNALHSPLRKTPSAWGWLASALTWDIPGCWPGLSVAALELGSLDLKPQVYGADHNRFPLLILEAKKPAIGCRHARAWLGV